MSGFLSRLFFPEFCPLCQRPVKDNEIVKWGCCSECYEKHIYSNKQAVIVCPEFAPFVNVIFCSSFYFGPVKEAMEKFKFHGETYIGKYFGRMLYSVVKDSECIENTDFVTTVPVSEERFKERGYNQSFLIAKEFCRLSDLPYIEVLERNRQGTSQSGLLIEDRRKLVEERFNIKKDCPVKGSSVLLIDDILTTGSTVNQCSSLLKKAGASWITVACVTGGRKEFT